MELERVCVTDCKSPCNLTLQNPTTKVKQENCGVFNCVPKSGKDWPAEATELIRFWLASADAVWFLRMDKASGLVFFKDPQLRIVNVRELLVQLQLGKNLSFLFLSLEKKRVTKLKQDWSELHDLTIDYKEFLIMPKRESKVLDEIVQAPIISKKPREEPLTVDDKLESNEVPMETNAEEQEMELRTIHPPPEATPKQPSRKINKQSVAEPEPKKNYYQYYPDTKPIFVYGKDHPVPYKSHLEVPFDANIKAKLTGADPFTCHCWSVVEADRSLIAIQSLTNMIIEPALFNYLKYKAVHNLTAPAAVIIVDDAKTAEEVSINLKAFNVFYTEQVQQCLLVDQHNAENEELAELIRCDVLILTLGMMESLLGKRVDGFHLHTTKMLVLQNVHNMSPKTLQDVLVYFDPLHKKQVMVTSNAWLPSFKKLFTDLGNPIMCFGSPIEVAFREDTKLMVRMANSQDEQLEKLIDVLKDQSTGRVAVVFRNRDAIPFVDSGLRCIGLEPHVLGETPKQSNILLMTDKELNNMLIDPVDTLIHWSIPKWEKFSRRFTLLESHFINQTRSQTILLLNIQDYNQFLPELESLLQPNRQLAIVDLRAILCQLKAKTEQLPEKEGKLFCSDLVLYGACKYPLSCPNRHTLTERDAPNVNYHIPERVELKICEVVTPNHFRVEVIPAADIRQQVRRQQLELRFKMNSFFGRAENRVPKKSFLPGEICVINVGQYRRARVLSEPKTAGRLSKVARMMVQCLETGKQFTLLVGAESIYEAPVEFQAYPPQVFDAYVFGCTPYEMASDWSRDSLSKLTIKLSTYENDTDCNPFYASGTMSAFLGSQIYLKNLKIYEKLSVGVDVVSVDIRDWLVNHMHARASYEEQKHFERMVNEFESRFPDILKYKQNLVIEDDQPEPKEEVEVEDTNDEALKEKDIHLNRDSGVGIGVEDTCEAVEDHEEMDDEETEFHEAAEKGGEEEVEEVWEDDNDETFQYVAPEEDFDCEFDDNFDGDEAELLQLILGLNPMANEPPRAFQHLPPATIEEIVEEDAVQMEEKEDDYQKVKEEIHLHSVPFLKSPINFPEVQWSQTDDHIKLYIIAGDLKSYRVMLRPRFARIYLELADSTFRGGVINFFGFIDHIHDHKVELRGLIVYVTMNKLVKGPKFHWPRLLDTKVPAKWLKYRQHFDVGDEEESSDKIDAFIAPCEVDESDPNDKVDLEYYS